MSEREWERGIGKGRREKERECVGVSVTELVSESGREG